MRSGRYEGTHPLHDAIKGLSVAAVDEPVGNHTTTLMMEESREELRALTHLRLHRQDALIRQNYSESTIKT